MVLAKKVVILIQITVMCIQILEQEIIVSINYQIYLF